MGNSTILNPRNRFFIALVAMFFSVSLVNAQNVSVTGASGTAGPYATLAAAFTAINGTAQTGNTITIGIINNTTEPAAGAILNAGAWTSITISPAGTAGAKTITGAATAGLPLIDFNGADKVTINGLNTGGNSLTISNTTASGTTGTSTIRFIGGATQNKITNCSVLGSFSAAVGTNGGTIYFATDATTTAGNDNNEISNCNIGPAGTNLPTKGIYMNGSTGTTAIGNNSNLITNNDIYDFFGAAVSSAGIYVAGGSQDNTFSYNRFYQTATRTQTTGSQHSAIWITNTTAGAGAIGYAINGNIIGFASYTGSSASSSGTTVTVASTAGLAVGMKLSVTSGTGAFATATYVTAITNATTFTVSTTPSTPLSGAAISGTAGSATYSFVTVASSMFVPIFLNGPSSGTLSVFQFNTIAGIAMSGAASGAGTSAPFKGIFINAGINSSNNNTIGSLSSTGSITYTSSSSVTSEIVGIYNFGSDAWTTNNNNIGGITVANSSTGAGNLYGLRANISTSVTWACSNNVIGGTVSNSMQSTTTSTSSLVVGISMESSAPATTATGNTIRNLTAAGGTGTTTSASVVGISSGSGANHTLSQNTIYALSNTNASAATVVTGIQFTGGTTNTVSRNFIHSLSAASTAATINGISVAGGTTTYSNNMIRLGINSAGAAITTACAINGISEPAGTAVDNFYFNSVYVGGTGVGTTASNTFAFNSLVITNTRSFRNNIFVNARSNSTTGGKHYAVQVGGTAANPAGLTINYNDYVVSGTGGTFGRFNAADVASIAAWRTAAGQDVNSINSDPAFADATGVTPDLHLTSGSLCEGAGILIATVTDDFDGDTRSSFTPTDMGADAGNFTVAGLNMGATALVAPASVVCGTTQAVTVTVKNFGSATIDFSVNPVVVNVTGTGAASTYGVNNVTLNSGTLAAGASQNVSFPTIDMSASGTYTFNAKTTVSGDINTANDAIAAVNITSTVLGGTYSVGTGSVSGEAGHFANLTAAVAAYNAANCFTGNVSFILTNSSYTAETYPLAINANAAAIAGSYTLTIKPNTGLTPVISNTGTAAVFTLNGARFVTIDGSNTTGGSTKDLTILNSNTGVTSSGTIVFTGDAANNQVTNAKLQGVSTNANTGVVYFSNTATAGNSNNTINNCDISGSSSSVTPTACIYSAGLSSTVLNATNTVSNCNIFDYFITTGTSAGVLLGSNNDNWTISNNKFYQTVSRAFSTITASSNAAIQISAGSGGDDFQITGNTIGYASASGTGVYTISGVVDFSAISLAATANTAVSNISNNTITAISIATSKAGANTSAPFNGIYIGSGTTWANISGNTIGSLDNSTSIALTSTSTSGSDCEAIYSQSTSSQTTDISNNNIGSITTTNSSTGTADFYGIYTSGSLSATYTVNNNKIGFAAAAAITSSGTNTGTQVWALTCSNSKNTVSGNTICYVNMNAPNTGSVPNLHAMAGININASGTQQTVTQNLVHSLSNTATTGAENIVGIMYSGPTTGTNVIGRNLVHSLNSASNAASVTGIYINLGTATIQNNMVRLGINNAGSSIATEASFTGIRKEGSSVTAIYFNSIYIGGSGVGSTATNTYALYRTATTTDPIQNNILSNVRSNTGSGGKHYSLYLVSTTGTGSINANVYRYTGNGGVFAFKPSADVTAYSSGWLASDVNSNSAEPNFTNPTGNAAAVDLHLSSPTSAEGTGVANATVTDDYDGQTRSGLTAVDMGADAGNFTALDVVAPAITAYTALPSICTVADVALNTITITDAGSGVPATGAYVPRIYYNKNGGAWASSAGTLSAGNWNFTLPVSSSLSAQPGDTINYYVVAQDVTGNLISSPAGAVGADVTAVTTHPTTPNSFFIGLSGVINIGTRNSGGKYANLTTAISAYNTIHKTTAGGIPLCADVTFSLLSTYPAVAETVPMTVNAISNASNYVLTVKPASGVTTTITGSNTGGLLVLSGADNIVVDGSNTVGGTTRNLTITNTGTAANTTAVLLTSLGAGAGARANTIKNCNISTGATANAAYGISIGSTPGVSGADNDNITVQNNNITGCAVGIFAAGTASGSAGGLDNLFITSNAITVNNAATTAIGIQVQNSLTSSISQNTISVTTSAATAPVGISLETGFVSSSVSKNNITAVNATNTGGYGGRGITVGTGTTNSALVIANNFISGVTGSNETTFGNSSSMGIAIGIIGSSSTLTTTAGGVNLYYNSVNLYGSYVRAANALTAALYIGSSASALDIRNNIFVNALNNTSASGASSKAYAIYSAAASSAFTTINYNNYFTTGTQGVLGFLTSDRTNLAGIVSGFGGNANSVSLDPQFTSTSNLHVSITGNNMNAIGTPIAAVPVDYDGDARDGTSPDIGADEFTPASCSAVTLGTATVTSTTASIPFTCPSCTPGNAYIAEYGAVGYTPSTGATYTNGNTGSASPISLPASGSLTPNTSYDVYVRQDCSSASTGYSPNSKVTITTLPTCGTLSTPADNATGVCLFNPTFTWLAPTNGAAGYKFYLGTDGAGTTTPTTVANGTVLGNVLTYTPAVTLAANTNYYWQVVPTNASGSAAGPCSIFKFTTATANTGAQAPPVTQNFDCINDWNLVNGTQTNKWMVGTATNNSGPNSIYISNNASANAYTSTSAESVVHFYKDVTFPAGHVGTLTFDWKALGESSYDRLVVFIAPTTVTPAAGTPSTAGSPGNTAFAGATLKWTQPNNSQSTFVSSGNITLSTTDIGNASSSATARIIFTWQNDNSGGSQTPAAVDNISITSVLPPAPNCATYTTPANAATNICQPASLNWTAPSSGGTPSGYKLYFGTDGGGITDPTSVVNGTNIGNVLTYAFSSLTANTTYYWKVVPTNATGDATGCSIQSFTTAAAVETTTPVTDNFEACPEWTIVNGTTNKWVTGTAAANGGTKSMYISNDNGVSNAYTTGTAQTAHFYRDVTFPAGHIGTLSFDWRGLGEANYDRLIVYIAPTSVTPVAGTPSTAGNSNNTALSGATLKWTQPNNAQSTFVGSGNITLTTADIGNTSSSATARIIFTWQNDASGGSQTPAAVDNISITSALPAPPVCATYSSPANAATNVCVPGNLTWVAPSGGGAPTGYKLYFGTDGGGVTNPTSVVNGTNLGNVLTYAFSSLSASTTYYWKVVPTNGGGDATGCAIQSFTTSAAAETTTPIADDFENCPEWTIVNGATTKWVTGTAASNGGARGVYISNDNGVSNAYTTGTSQTSHFYRDVTFPAGQTIYNFTFDYKGAPGDNSFDRLLVYIAPTTVTPVAGTPASNSTTLSGATLLYSQSANISAWTNISVPLTSTQVGNASANSTMRIIFTWQNDNTGGGGTPAAVDNVSITSVAPAPIVINTVTTTQVTGGLAVNTSNNDIIKVNVATTGTSGGLALSTLKVTSGNTSDADFTNVKLWGGPTATVSSHGSSVLAAGSFVAGAVTFTGLSSALVSGNNYFWITYDVAAGATAGHIADAKILAGDMTFTPTSPSVATGTQPATLQDPSGSRPILLPLCGTTYTINNTLPTSGLNYNSFTDAINDLNTYGLNCAVTFNVKDGQTFNEKVPAIATTGTATNVITFQRDNSGSSRPTLVGTTGTGTADAVVQLNGVDYLRWDGINIADNAANANNTTRFEYGVYLNGLSGNGTKNNIFKNSNITLTTTNTSTRGVYTLAAGGTGGDNSNNQFLNLQISNVVWGYDLEGATSGTYDDSNEINTNAGGTSSITNIGSAANSATYGVVIGYQTNFKLKNTAISNLTGASNADVYGFYASAGALSTMEVSSNTISGISISGSNAAYVRGVSIVSSASATVSKNSIRSLSSDYFVHAIYNMGGVLIADSNIIGGNGTGITSIGADGYATGINCISSGTNGHQITNNTLSYIVANGGVSCSVDGIIVGSSNCNVLSNTLQNLSTNGTSAVVPSDGIYVYASSVAGTVVNGNTISNCTTSSSSDFNAIESEGAGTTITNNTISGFAATGAGYILGVNVIGANTTISGNTFTNLTVTSGDIYAVYGGSTGTALNVRNNTMSSFSATGSGNIWGAIFFGSNVVVRGNTISGLTTATGTCSGIVGDVSSSAATINGNTISGLSSTGASVVGAIGDFGSGTNTISGNTIDNIVSTMAGSTIALGIRADGGSSGTFNITNNMVSKVIANASTITTGGVRGISLEAGATARVFNNTVYLAGTSTSAAHTSGALFLSGNGSLDYRNNILVNNYNPTTGTAASCVYTTRSAANTLSQIATTSNNNILSNGGYGKSYLLTTNAGSQSTLSTYQSTLASPRETASLFVTSVPFVQVSTLPSNLHIDLTSASLCAINNKGVAITTPITVPDDIDTVNVRGTTPDVGADEWTMPIPAAGTAAASVNPACPSANNVITISSTGAVTGSEFSYQWQVNNGGGYVDITNTGIYTGATTTTLTLTGYTTAINGYKYKLKVNRCSPSAAAGFSNEITLTVSCDYVWTGLGSDNNWTTAGNWNIGVPVNVCGTTVTIPAGTPRNPVLTGAVSVGDITLGDSKTLDLGVNTLSACGNWTGGTTSPSTVTGTGSVILTGSAAQAVSGRTAFTTLHVTKTGGSTATLQANSFIDVTTAVELESGTLATGTGTLTFKSTSLTQVAVLDNFTAGYTGTLTGSIVAERAYASASAGSYSQHYMGSPVSNATLAQFGGGSSSGFVTPTATCSETQLASTSVYGSVFSYDQANGGSCALAGWKVEAGAAAAVPAKGFSVARTGAGTLTVTGNANLNASYTQTGANSNWANSSLQGRPMTSGWLLVSNPYLATLNLTGAPTQSGFTAQIKVWNTTGPFAGTYQDATVIAPFQAFFVQKQTTGGNTYTIDGARRTRSTQTFQQNNNDQQLSITATNTTTTLADITMVAFNSDATDQFDADYDGQKIAGSLGRHTLYTVGANNLWMSKNVLHDIATTSTVTMGFEPEVSGSYTFSFEGLNSFDPTSYITLEDRKLNTFYDVRNGDYNFTADSADQWERFVLHFTPAAQITTTDENCNTLGNIIVTQPGTANWNYTITDNNNATIASGTLNETTPINAAAQTGTYVITLVDNNNYTVAKTVTVSGTSPVAAVFTPSVTVAETNQAVSFNSSSVATNYYWDFGDGTTATGQNAIHNYSDTGTYTVTLIVISEGGCSSTTTQTITVNQTATGITTLNGAGPITIWSNGNRVFVDFSKQSKVEAEIQIYNVIGQELVNEKYGRSTVYSKPIGNIEAAYVIVKVKNGNSIVTKKVFIGN